MGSFTYSHPPKHLPRPESWHTSELNELIVKLQPELVKPSHPSTIPSRAGGTFLYHSVSWSPTACFGHCLTMPGFANTLLIEGSFEELCEELAHYIDNIKSDAQVHSEVVSALQQNKKDDALNVLVKSSATLNAAPERGTSVVAQAGPHH